VGIIPAKRIDVVAGTEMIKPRHHRRHLKKAGVRHFEFNTQRVIDDKSKEAINESDQ